MLFNSFQFVFFFAAVYGLYRILGHKGQNVLILLASYVFYGCWDWRFLFLLWLSTIVDFLCARWINSASVAGRKRSWLILSIFINLSILGFFKYFNFFADSFRVFAGFFGLDPHPWTLQVILPVGVSFYTFQSISYVVDVYRGRIKPEREFFHYALFVAFFPQLVAGPIERAGHMLKQYKEPRVITSFKNKEGAWFIFWGLFLKIFMADNLAKIVEIVFNQNGSIPAVEIILGSYAFAFQIFGDFAGYSFIAMGIARLLGFDLMVNFLYPYFVTNPSEFWRNWHISLSTWLRDYLYIPLGGNRNGAFKTYRNLFLTMLLGGLWHGAAWTYVIWGAYQGLTLIAHRIFRTLVPVKGLSSGIGYVVKAVAMFQVTCLGWLIFRAGSLEHLQKYFSSLFFNPTAHSSKTIYLILQIIFYSALTLIIMAVQKKKNDLLAITRLGGICPWLFYLAMFYLLVFWGEYGGKQFIYFQF